MYTITITGDDRGLSNIKYTGDQSEYISLVNPTELSLILEWMKCIDMVDMYYQNNDGKFPAKILEEVLS